MNHLIEEWLTGIINQEKKFSSIAIAAYFGIFESDDGFSIYLYESQTFDENDDDWACIASPLPSQRYLNIINSNKKMNWMELQDLISGIINDLLMDNQLISNYFKNTKAIAVGFDDGDLLRIK